MKAIKIIFKCLAAVIVLLILNSVISTTEVSRKRITAIIKRKYPSYQIISLEPEYTDWSSTVCEADDHHNPETATVVIKNEEEQRTIHFDKHFGLWRISKNEPDYGKNVPDDVYFVETTSGNAGKNTDIEEYIKEIWIIPYENGELYKKVGEEDWYYSYRCILNMYRTENGSVYVLNKDSLEWETADLAYSYLDYYGNYSKISKDEAENIISTYRNNNEH